MVWFQCISVKANGPQSFYDWCSRILTPLFAITAWKHLMKLFMCNNIILMWNNCTDSILKYKAFTFTLNLSTSLCYFEYFSMDIFMLSTPIHFLTSSRNVTGTCTVTILYWMISVLHFQCFTAKDGVILCHRSSQTRDRAHSLQDWRHTKVKTKVHPFRKWPATRPLHAVLRVHHLRSCDPACHVLTHL